MRMAYYLDIAAIVMGFVAAVLWFVSARCRLTKIAPGLEELDRVTDLAGDLQRMSNWNAWAAGTTGAAVLLQMLAKFI